MSFLSVEPQSRVLLESHSNSLLAQIDTQLDIIADRYLAFFQERRSIEATYIDSLRRLHRKAKMVDASFGPRAEPTTTRAAWDKVRDNLEKVRDFSFRRAPLFSDKRAIRKESNDKTRKRVEEDLKKSAAKYADHAENTISKLQQAYLEKYYPRFRDRWEDLREAEPAKSEEVFGDDCRKAVSGLNCLRFERAENLRDGYDYLEELVFTPTVKDVLVKYMDGMTTMYDELAMSTRAQVEKTLAETKTSDLRASFRHALSFSIPPLTPYHNYRPGAYSELIFGVPLVDLMTNEDNVPKVMRMCIEEVEKRGLNTKNIYLLGRRVESEKSFSFSSTDNIYSVAALLRRYLWDLPEPLFTLSLQDYRNYGRNRARYTGNDLSVLRSKIRELHPVQRASLGALSRHLLRVASHSDKNAMTVEVLLAKFSYAVLRGNVVLQEGIHVKARRDVFL
ncbi:Rho GTPase activation protein [Lactarius psammicola]|nr:Rho GTPase activation protein [Lactarius psammicola]